MDCLGSFDGIYNDEFRELLVIPFAKFPGSLWIGSSDPVGAPVVWYLVANDKTSPRTYAVLP